METISLFTHPIVIEVIVGIIFMAGVWIISQRWSITTVNTLKPCLESLNKSCEKLNETFAQIMIQMAEERVAARASRDRIAEKLDDLKS